MNNITALDTSSLIHYVEEGIAYLVLNRPEKRNAFDAQLIQDMIQAIHHFQTLSEVRCLVLKAAGRHYSAGADLGWMKQMANFNHQENLEDAGQLAYLMESLFRFPKPTITLIQGAAYGGALGFIACCDIALASQDAKFCFSEVRLGLAPAVISPYVLHKVGQRHARRYFLTAEQFDAQQAYQMGLINAVINEEELENEGMRIASCILDAAPQALEETKSLLNLITQDLQPFDQKNKEYTTDLIARLRVSIEGQEGLSAFFEKRRPAWQKEV